MVVTTASIRYGYQTKGGASDMKHRGEVTLKPGTFDASGALQNSVYFEDALREILAAHKWKGLQLAYTFVDDSVYIQRATVPGKLTDQEVLAYVRTHNGTEFDLPFDYSALAVDVLTDTSKKSPATDTEFRLYAYPLDKFDKLSTAFRAVGLKPVAAELTGMAVYRYYMQSLAADGATPPRHVMLTHWNAAGVYVTMFQDDCLVFNRYIKLTMPKHVTSKAVNRLVDDAIFDISKLVEFYQTSVMDDALDDASAIGVMVVTGDFEFIDIAERKLGATFDFDVFDVKSAPEPIAHKAPRRKKAQTPEAPALGHYGRSTRMSSFSLEYSKRADGPVDLKYIDLLGLGLKSAGR